MLKVLSCIATEHDVRLVLLAGFICLLSSATAFGLYARARSAPRSRRLWLSASGLAAGSGVWVTHFIAMLAYEPGLKTGYAPVLTSLSWLIAIAGIGASFTAAVAWPTLRGRLCAGAALGLSVAAMHFVGMNALRTEGVLVWDPLYVAVAIALGAGFGAAGLALAGEADRLPRQLAGATLVTLAICGLHFTAMTAVTIQPDPTVAVPPMLLSSGVMAVVLAAIIAVIILAAAAAVLVETRAQRHAFTALSQSAEALALARDQAEAANRSRSEFLTAMSHELRTPLNGVMGVVQALGATRLTREQREMLKMLDDSAQTLQRELAQLFVAAGANAAWAGTGAPTLLAPSGHPEPAAAPDVPEQRLRVLIAEDHPVNRKVLEMMLSAFDLDLTFAENGAEAVEAFRTERFGFVFMDMQMPVMDGLDATRAIRAWERRTGADRTPVVMLTAHALPEHAEASRAAGCDRHMTKPVSTADLVAVLQEFCGGDEGAVQAA